MSLQLPRLGAAGAVFSISSVLLLGVVLVLCLAGPGCREQISAPVDRNLPPQTVLVGVPGDSTTTFYRVSMYWYGNDPDGEVDGYEWAITDSLPPGGEDAIEYNWTTRTDSTFIFEVEEGREVVGRRFYVRAVDNEGKHDPTPAWAFFAVRNSGIPVAWFTRSEALGPGGDVKQITSTDRRTPTDTIPFGWDVRFGWTGEDSDLALNTDGTVDTVGHITGYTYHLVPLEMNYIGGEFSDSVAYYGADRLSSGNHTMFVRARDDAGLSSLDPAVRTFVYNMDPVTYFTREAVEEGSADSFKAFYANVVSPDPEDYAPYAQGDTLPLTAQGVRTYANIRAYDPDHPHEILRYQARQIRDAGFWVDLGSDQVFRQTRSQYTGTYRLMCRSMDFHGRWDGTPDTIVFHVNRPPRFTQVWEDRNGSQEQRPLPGATYSRADGDFFPADTVMVARVAAYDPDPFPGLGVEFRYRFSTYPLEGGGQGSETRYLSSWMRGRPTVFGSSIYQLLDLACKKQNRRPFHPGRYVLAIQARDYYADDTARQSFGARTTERFVEFHVN